MSAADAVPWSIIKASPDTAEQIACRNMVKNSLVLAGFLERRSLCCAKPVHRMRGRSTFAVAQIIRFARRAAVGYDPLYGPLGTPLLRAEHRASNHTRCIAVSISRISIRLRFQFISPHLG